MELFGKGMDTSSRNEATLKTRCFLSPPFLDPEHSPQKSIPKTPKGSQTLPSRIPDFLLAHPIILNPQPLP